MATPKQIKRYILEKILKTTVKLTSQQGLSAKTLRSLMDASTAIFPVDKSLQFKSLNISGIHCEEIKKRNSSPTQMIFHIHGGAFFLGGLKSHRGFMCDLVNYTNMQVLHCDYPLAPEYPYPNALSKLYDVYLGILEQGIHPKDITLSGDSCGGNLALALCMKLRDDGKPMPSGIVLLSPWLDLSLSGESLRLNKKHDALLSNEALEDGVKYYITEDTSVDEAYVSPMFGNLKGLPEILVQVGSKEILLDDAKRFKELADEAGAKVTLSIFPGMWHNFHMFNHWVEDAKTAMQDIARFVDHVDH